MKVCKSFRYSPSPCIRLKYTAYNSYYTATIFYLLSRDSLPALFTFCGLYSFVLSFSLLYLQYITYLNICQQSFCTNFIFSFCDILQVTFELLSTRFQLCTLLTFVLYVPCCDYIIPHILHNVNTISATSTFCTKTLS